MASLMCTRMAGLVYDVWWVWGPRVVWQPFEQEFPRLCGRESEVCSVDSRLGEMVSVYICVCMCVHMRVCVCVLWLCGPTCRSSYQIPLTATPQRQSTDHTLQQPGNYSPAVPLYHSKTSFTIQSKKHTLPKSQNSKTPQTQRNQPNNRNPPHGTRRRLEENYPLLENYQLLGGRQTLQGIPVQHHLLLWPTDTSSRSSADTDRSNILFWLRYCFGRR